MVRQQALIEHQQALSECRLCPKMIPPVILGPPVVAKILLVGQAPGIREGELARPFAWTAGKTLFKWLQTIGMDEVSVRQQVYISAVCRCFPGKKPKGGDRVPDKTEIAHCAQWLNREIELLQPVLIIPVGKLAIQQFLSLSKLVEVIGQQFRQDINGVATVIIPLPHPSGASTWHQMAPGKTLLKQALSLIQQQPAWQKLVSDIA